MCDKSFGTVCETASCTTNHRVRWSTAIKPLTLGASTMSGVNEFDEIEEGWQSSFHLTRTLLRYGRWGRTRSTLCKYHFHEREKNNYDSNIERSWINNAVQHMFVTRCFLIAVILINNHAFMWTTKLRLFQRNEVAIFFFSSTIFDAVEKAMWFSMETLTTICPMQ